MGLDSFFFAVKKGRKNKTFSHPKKRENHQVHAWFSRFYGMHRWMENMARTKGLPAEVQFNGVRLRLRMEDLDCLEADIKSGTLMAIFPPSDDEEEPTSSANIEETLQAIAKSRIQIQAGYDIYYDSWW